MVNLWVNQRHTLGSSLLGNAPELVMCSADSLVICAFNYFMFIEINNTFTHGES